MFLRLASALETMGKKTKKNRPKAASNKHGNSSNNNKNQNSSPQNQPPPKLSADQKSLYTIYKYSTEIVIDWARKTYWNKHKKTKSSKNNPKEKTSSYSLTKVILECLTSLAKTGVLMPEPVLRDLRTTIALRKRVGAYYRSVPSASEEDHARHEWLIVQLEKLERLFSQQRHDDNSGRGDGEDGEEMNGKTQQGFAALALTSDEEESEDEEDDNERADKRKKIGKAVPTAKELQAEERSFAISLLLCEIDEICMDLQIMWKEWATQSNSFQESTSTTTTTRTTHNHTHEGGANLLAATASAQYAIGAVRKLILQTSVEFHSFEDFHQILHAFGSTAAAAVAVPVAPDKNRPLESKSWAVNDCVTIRNLQKRPDLNGKHGRICGREDNGRFPVHIFPVDGDDEAPAGAKQTQIISVKPENLVPSDNTFLRLGQIHDALKAFDFATVPKPCDSVYGAPASVDFVGVTMMMLSNADKFRSALKDRDFGAFLKLMVRYILPQWISLARYAPASGAADTVLVAFARNYADTRTVDFYFAFALLAAMDSAFALDVADRAEQARTMYCKILEDLFDGPIYTAAIEAFNRDNAKPDAFYSHYEFARHFREEFSEMCCYFPLLSGEMLLMGLRLHFVCASGLPYRFCQSYTTLLHIYWMLRCEGYIGRLPEIENTLIGMYRQQVWFHGGIPQKGKDAYLKSWQLALGATLHTTKLLGGQQVARRSQEYRDLSREGLFVTEISRLLDILQWKTMPILDSKECFREIQEVAREEFHAVFTAPLMKTCVKMCNLEEALKARFTATARASGERMIDNYSLVTSKMNNLSVVCFWAMALADNCSLNSREKDGALPLLAKQFKNLFVEEPVNSDADPSLAFSPYDHRVDSSLWGEKGVVLQEHQQV